MREISKLDLSGSQGWRQYGRCGLDNREGREILVLSPGGLDDPAHWPVKAHTYLATFRLGSLHWDAFGKVNSQHGRRPNVWMWSMWVAWSM